MRPRYHGELRKSCPAAAASHPRSKPVDDFRVFQASDATPVPPASITIPDSPYIVSRAVSSASRHGCTAKRDKCRRKACRISPFKRYDADESCASIWVDETERGPKYNTIFTKLYKAGDRWQDTAHFGVNDLPLIVQVAELARAWILQQNAG